MASAAEKVFDVPELLEKNPATCRRPGPQSFSSIRSSLDLLCHFSRRSPAERPGVERYFEPFQASHTAIQVDVDPAIFGPLLWLEDQIISLLRFRGVARAQNGVLTIAFHILSKDALVAWVSDRKDESWRQVKCLTNSSGVPGLRSEVKTDARCKSDKASRISELGSTATLGEVADILENAP
ncbi:hypothetical protein CKM354_001036300 [Cercospora kikuchii]|uniref:Uncharacterized protein n=1 Tax=Cercospora kikuchii TaxID=84275 RepID=A0A9P3FH81_9PEZI|nr:uncharacterized protein CKM354_001036300 [Cercospora kikuchii]GIZ47266.1 hypothetical protein CKM354_001036300 [Cercospora kikuchii]